LLVLYGPELVDFGYLFLIFCRCIGSIEKMEELEERLKILANEVTLAVHKNITRSLFSEHKLLFSFIVCCEILKSKKAISESEWEFFLNISNTTTNSLLNSKQQEINCDCELIKLVAQLEAISGAAFAGLSDTLLQSTTVLLEIGSFKIFLSLREENQLLHDDDDSTDLWNKTLTNFQKVVLVKRFQQEMVTQVLKVVIFCTKVHCKFQFNLFS